MILKVIYYKLYEDLQLLLVSIYHEKNITIDYITSLLFLLDLKNNCLNTLFIIIDYLTKMIYYNLVKTTVNMAGQAKIIFDVMVKYHSLPMSIIIDQDSLLTSKFRSLLCLILGIK